MPPGKKASNEPINYLGRPSNTLQLGIVGLPNVGKSLLFNVLTKLNVPSENFPFCTIDPTTARVGVPDSRFNWLCELYKPASEVCAQLSVVDIAGLVRGASEGEGLGNAFLSHVRAVDGIFHVLRIFNDPEVTHVEGAVDPLRDVKIIKNELIKKDLEFVEKKLEALQKTLRNSNRKEDKDSLEICTKVHAVLLENREVRHQRWGLKEVDFLNEMLLLTAKPVVFLVNMSEADYLRKGSKWLPPLKELIDKMCEEDGADEPDPIIPFSAEMEKRLMDLETDDERKAWCDEHKTQSAIPKIVRTGYHAIHLVHFFTAGEDEVKCWTVREGSKAPEAAGVIHTDFRDGFIKAEVMHFKDLKELGTEAEVKAKGKYLTKGKDYVVEDGDICFFRFNAPTKKK